MSSQVFLSRRLRYFLKYEQQSSGILLPTLCVRDQVCASNELEGRKGWGTHGVVWTSKQKTWVPGSIYNSNQCTTNLYLYCFLNVTFECCGPLSCAPARDGTSMGEAFCMSLALFVLDSGANKW
jgi:hypothetical protein